MLEKLKSAVYNNVVTGLKGSVNYSFSLEQVEDSIMSTRLEIIKEYSKNGTLPVKDLINTIRCLKVDCKSIDGCCGNIPSDKIQHIEIPQVVNDYGNQGIDFLGSTDREIEFMVYTNSSYRRHQYRRRGKNKPYAWIDTSPNANNMNDVFIFNAPMLTNVTISAIFKDLRQLEDYSCCSHEEIYNFSFIDSMLEKRVTDKFLRYYRQFSAPITRNDQSIKP